VRFDGLWVLAREETHCDVVGFLHTHPDGPAAPSDRDVRTMRAWCLAFGKPLLCLIESPAGLCGYRFDNSASRRLVQEQCRALQLPCLHVGLYADYAEVIWDEHYRVPRDAAGDVCDYPLARNLVLLAAVASEALARHALSGVRQDVSITLRDFSVGPLEA
jgi:hypothetical protein